MRFTLRIKLFTIVVVTAIALIALTVSSSLSDHAVETQIDRIRDTYLPKIRLRPALEGAFLHLEHTIQNATAAADADQLAAAAGEHDALIQLAQGARDAMTVSQSIAVQRAINEYYDAALTVSRRLIGGGGGEEVAAQVQDMQAKRGRVMALIDQTTAFDEHALTAAFTATKADQSSATVVRIVVGAICLVALGGISFWIGTTLLGNVGALVAGFERFGRNDFATPIVPTSSDELAELAIRANQMAVQLQRLDLERERHEWVRTGLAGLSDELRGELEPREVAERTVRYLARYLQAPVGALYHLDQDGRLHLLGGHALADGVAPPTFAVGEGLVGQAALQTAPMIVDAGEAPGLELRSGLIAVRPRTLVLLPLARATSVTGVLELGSIRAWRDRDTELLVLGSETISIALEVAQGRAASRALLEQTQQQAHELKCSSAALEQKADELAKANKYKSQFLANMSHELRTPLNAIIGFSELMYDGAVPLDPPTMKEYLGDILSSGHHLLQLINDVLDLAKVEAGKLEFFPEPLELPRVVGEVLAVLRTTSAKQQVVVTSEIAGEVAHLVLDSGRLKQVLYNYLSNALKFTPPGGRVTVRAIAEPGDRVRIEVEDSGIGIAPDQIGRLFGDFQQTEDGARKSGGTGLGLALTKRLVEAQGGEVGVRSTVGKGSTFYAVLPRQAGIAAAVANTLQVVRAGDDARTILVIEDDPPDRARIVSMLSAAGYTVESVATGAEAIARCDTQVYDAITLDLLLPDMTGLEAMQQLRHGPNGSVPIIVVTVVAEPGAVAGFAVHDVLAKPLSEPALLAALRSAGVEAESRGSVVLVVDDDPGSLKVMAASLGRLGYVAVCEQDPVRGLRTATDEPPSAIVLDLLMPGMTGFEFLDRFRVTDAARGVPVIVWTSKDLTAQEREQLRHSAHAVVTKGHDGNTRVLAELAASLPARAAGAS